MVGLTESKIAILRSMVEASPDKVVGDLQNALASTSGDTALADVRRLVDAEAGDRRLRNFALRPVSALFVGDGRAADRLVFPARALALIWRGLKVEAPADVAAAAAAMDAPSKEADPQAVLDALTQKAAAGLRARAGRDFQAAAELCDQARPDGAALLCSCLDLGPMVRGATGKLGEWISRTTEETTAAARLAYSDAVEVYEDGGARFFEMLASQLAQPWMILRIISAAMDKPTETYLAQSEFSSFAERLMDDIDRNLASIAKLDANGGPSAGRAGAKLVETVTLQVSELEETITLARTGLWGARVAKQKQALAVTVEERLRAVEKHLALALPTHVERVARMRKTVPTFTAGPDAAAVRQATTMLIFAHEIRASAAHGGFASIRSKTLEAAAEAIDDYVEESLDQLRHGDAPTPIALQYLALAADLSATFRDPKVGEIIRRRAAAASADQPSAA